MNRLSNYKTTIKTHNGTTRIVYHSICIVEFNSGEVTLRTGGYKTMMTKIKMNQASQQFDLGYGVMQKKGDWFLRLPSGKVVPFDDTTIGFSRDEKTEATQVA
jgi:hypothetical protein